MNAVPFDTLKLARKLEASGMAGSVAAGTAEALAEAMSGAQLATKADTDGIKADLEAFKAWTKAEFDAARASTKADIDGLRAWTKAEFEAARAATKADIDGLRAWTKAEFEAARATTKADIDGLATKADMAHLRGEVGILRKDMELMGRDITIKLGGIVVMGIGVLLAAIRYLPPHP